MDLGTLRDQACASLYLLIPQVGDSSRLVDECLTSARKSFRDEFILSLGPQVWAHIALVHVTTFLDSGVDVPVGDLCAAVLRDAVHLHRLDALAQGLVQGLVGAQHSVATDRPAVGHPHLVVVRDEPGEPQGG